jgi:hypothetical protein
MLNEYMQRTQLLLKDENFELVNDGDIVRFVNWARGQIAGQTECCRSMSTLQVTAPTQVYPFSSISFGNAQASGSIFFPANPSNADTATFNGVVWEFVTSGATGNQINIAGTCDLTITNLAAALTASLNASTSVASYVVTGGPSTCTLTVTYNANGSLGDTYTLAASAATPSGPTLTGGNSGLAGVLNVRQITYAVGQGQKFVHPRPFPYFNLFYLANAVPQAGAPTTWSQYGQGASGSFYINLPDINYSLSLDTSCYPTPLALDTDFEAIPYLFTDAVPFLAAHLSFLTLQQPDPAQKMMEEFEQFIGKARHGNTPGVLPGSFAQSPDLFMNNRLGLQKQNANA